MAAIKIPTIKRLREMLDYNPETGEFYWLKGIQVKRGKGFPAGCETKKEIRICLDGTIYLAHHLAWFYMTESWPTGEIDHRNTNSVDNRFINLRLATRRENSQNQGRRSDNTSGYTGVYYNKRAKKWQATIQANGKSVYLGIFALKEDAFAVYRQTALKLYGEFAHHSLR